MEKDNSNLKDLDEVFKMSKVDLQNNLKQDGKVSCLDKVNNCLYTLTTTNGFRQYFEKPSIRLKKEDLTTGIIEEKFYNISKDIDFTEIYKKFNDSRDISVLYSHCYVDVKTKYGTFCLEVDEHFSHSNYGPHRSLTLYNVTCDNEEFQNNYSKHIYPKFGVLKFKHMPSSNFNQWLVGYVDNVFQNSRRSVWNYAFDTEFRRGEGPQIYSISDYYESNLGFKGAIILDGNIKVVDVKNYLPIGFINLEVDEYEKEDVTSKVYYGASNTIVVLKNGYEIKVIYNVYNPRKNRKDEKESANIISLTDGKFTKDDFEKIIASLELMNIDIELKESFITELTTYINIHTSDFNTLTNTLENVSYQELKEIIVKSNLTEFVEKLIENMSETFSISTSGLLGKEEEKGLSRKINK